MGPMGFLRASSSSFSHCCLWSSLLMSSDNRVVPSGPCLIKKRTNKVRDYRAELTSFMVLNSKSTTGSDPLLQFLQNIDHCRHHLAMQHWWLSYMVKTEIQNYLWNNVLIEHVVKRLKQSHILSHRLYEIIIKSQNGRWNNHFYWHLLGF